MFCFDFRETLTFFFTVLLNIEFKVHQKVYEADLYK